MTAELKRIDFTKDRFEANGKTYLIRNTLNIDRQRHFEKFSFRVIYGKTMDQVAQQLNNAMVINDKGKHTEAWAIVYNLTQNLFANIHDQIDPVLKICSLFCVTEDEDITKWSVELADQKIADWNTEGIAHNDFFTLAINLVQNYVADLDVLSQTSLNLKQE